MLFEFHFAFFKFSIKIISVGRRLQFRLELKIEIGQELDSDMPFNRHHKRGNDSFCAKKKKNSISDYLFYFVLSEFNFIRKAELFD